MSLFFEVPGEPVGKARPRFTRHGHAYTPNKTRNYEREVIKAFRIAYPDHEPVGVPVALEIYAFFGVPESWSKRKREAALAGTTLPAKRPDWDNCGKAISDALNGRAYEDDALIVDASVQKRYASRPRVEVHIAEVRKP